MERMLVHYDLSRWIRREVPDELTNLRLECVKPEGRLFFLALSPKDGGEDIGEEPKYTIPLSEFIVKQGYVWVADAYWANEVTLHKEGALEKYKASLQKIYSMDDIPKYIHTREIYCWCGCGELEFIERVNYVEFIVDSCQVEALPRCYLCEAELEDDNWCPSCRRYCR